MYDVIIIGAGPVGLSLACSLADSGMDVALIEKHAEKHLSTPHYDGREIALTHFSKFLLEKMGVWQTFTPDQIGQIEQAKVLNGHSSYALHFDCLEVNQQTLGYMISNHLMRKALYQQVKSRKRIHLLSEQSVESYHHGACDITLCLSNGQTYSAALLVGADSRFSASRQHMGISASFHDFGKTILVCKVKHDYPHRQTAYECFHYGGTLAVLPLPGRVSSVVLTVSPKEAENLQAYTQKAFNTALTRQFAERFGAMTLVSPRFAYPLIACYAKTFYTERFALIGDAAVGMHPVTAHGFNLGLKGQDLLTQEISQARKKGEDIGSVRVLARYDRKHRIASRPLYLATNALAKLYTRERPMHKAVRKIVLHLGSHIRPAKRAIMHQLTETQHKEQGLF